MHVPEAVINNQLCYASEAGLWLPYSVQQLTDTVLKLRLSVAHAAPQATRYRVARSPDFGVCHTKKGKLCVHYGEEADALCDALTLEQVGDAH